MAEKAAKGALVAVRDRREEVIRILCDGYAADLLGEDEFEARLDRTHRANDLVTLDDIVHDLEVTTADTSLAPTPAATTELATTRAETKNIVAVLGGVDRKGSWRPPKKLRVFSLLGGADLDFREVSLPPGPTDIKVFSVLGGVDIIVPPGVAVECEGIAILGGFETLDRAPAVPDPSDPVLRISGFALLGGVDVTTRLPGESARQARRRRKRERKAQLKSRKERLLKE